MEEAEEATWREEDSDEDEREGQGAEEAQHRRRLLQNRGSHQARDVLKGSAEKVTFIGSVAREAQTNGPPSPYVDIVDTGKEGIPRDASNVDIVDVKRASPSGASNVDNVVTRGGMSQRGRQSIFGRPAAPMPQAAPSVDTVDNQGGRVSAYRENPEILAVNRADQDDFARSLADEGIEVLVEPYSGAHAAGSGATIPSGPSQGALEAIRRTARVKLELRARERGIPSEAGSAQSKESVSEQARKGTTVSQATLDAYLRRGQLLFNRYRREVGIDVGAEEISPVEFVNWLISLKPRLKSATWRMYRQCAYHYVVGFPHYDVAKAIGLLDTDVIDRSRAPRDEEMTALTGGDGKKVRRTSALKEKRFPLEDYDRVQTFLTTFSRSKLAPVLSDWLRAALLVGLRPIEWRTTELEVRDDPLAAYGRRAYLYVLSAKATNGRGTGVVRTLDLTAFPDAELECVRRMVNRGRLWFEDGRYADMQGQCSTLLYAATSKIWPTGRRYAYSLYSTRHQFIANMKVVLTPTEIAAIVGHGVTATASEHYGKRRSSWPPEAIPAPPRPVPEELSVVRDRIRLYQRRFELEIKAGLRRAGDVPDFPLG